MPRVLTITLTRRTVAAALVVVAIATAAFVVGRSTSNSTNRAATPASQQPSTAPSSSTTSVQPPTTVAPTTTTPTTPLPNFSAFAGPWGYHGAGANIRLDGTGTADWRIYKWCSDDPTPPCDSIVGNNIISGGHAVFHLIDAKGDTAYGTVTQSSDDKRVLYGPLVLRLLPDDHLQFPNLGEPLCGPHASPNTCGA